MTPTPPPLPPLRPPVSLLTLGLAAPALAAQPEGAAARAELRPLVAGFLRPDPKENRDE